LASESLQWEQQLLESWLDITARSENSHQLSSKFEPAEHWWEWTGYYQVQQKLSWTLLKIWTSSTLMRVNWILQSATKTLMNSTQNLNQMNTDESWLDITKLNKNSHELYSKFEPTEHWWELTGYYQAQQKLSWTLLKIWTRWTLMRVNWILLSATKTLMNSTQNLNQR
jgi:hypothetical protein